jgi:hypothetical protein
MHVNVDLSGLRSKMPNRGDENKLKVYTRDDVIRMLKAKQGSQRAKYFAQEIGVSAPYLNDVYAGNRTPSHKILSFLGLGREKTTVVTYFDLPKDGRK